MPKAFAPALVAVSLTGLVAIKDVGPGATNRHWGKGRGRQDPVSGQSGAKKRESRSVNESDGTRLLDYWT